MFRPIADIWRPERYHGRGKKAGFFEGWYFKVVDPSERRMYAFIPGISFAAEDSHSFIQVLNGANGETMSSIVRVALRRAEKSGGETLFEGEGRNAGLEAVGPVSELRPATATDAH
jgi:hypothetical protein